MAALFVKGGTTKPRDPGGVAVLGLRVGDVRADTAGANPRARVRAKVATTAAAAVAPSFLAGLKSPPGQNIGKRP
jgi:hypothetical protein